MNGSVGKMVVWVAVIAVAGCKTAEVHKPDPKVAELAPAPPPPPKVKKAEEDFAEGVEAFDAGDLKGARERFTEALKKAPGLVNAQYNVAVTYEREGQIAKAQKTYLEAHALDPSHGPTLLNLGKLYRGQGKIAEAIALYEKALAAPGREHDVQLLNNLTVAYRLAKDYPKAEATARRVLARTKDNPDAYKNLALIYYDQGNYRLAEFISANAKKLDDKDPGVYNNLGMIYLKMEDRPRALAQFQKAVSLDDRFVPGHMNLGAMALSYRDYVSAERSFAKAISLDPNAHEAHLYHAYALDGQKGRDAKKGLEAGASFEKVLALQPDHPEAICGAGFAYSVEKSGWEKARAFLEQCRDKELVKGPELQTVELKIKSLATMQAKGDAQPEVAEKREAPSAPGSGGEALLEKVSEEAAKAEGTTEAAPAPSEGAADGEMMAPPTGTGGSGGAR